MERVRMAWLRSAAPAPVAFEFGHRPPMLGRAGWLLWAIALAFAADVSYSYMHTHQKFQSMQQALVMLPAAPPATPPAPMQRADIDRAMAFARETIERIALPWSDLFGGLHELSVEGILLQTVEPDPQAGIVQVNAEAQDLAALLRYLERLESGSFFSSFMLTRHEARRSDPRRPIAFTVILTWNARGSSPLEQRR
jgi:hypothetical protein